MLISRMELRKIYVKLAGEGLKRKEIIERILADYEITKSSINNHILRLTYTDPEFKHIYEQTKSVLNHSYKGLENMEKAFTKLQEKPAKEPITPTPEPREQKPREPEPREPEPREPEPFEFDQETKDFGVILKIYAERFRRPTPDEVEALQEQYLILKQRGLDPVLWMGSSIKEISKKEKTKHNISYLIGLIRNRYERGWGVTRNDEEETVIQEIEKVISCKLSPDQRGRVYKLVGTYGLVRIGLSVNKIDRAEAFIEALEKILTQYSQEMGLRHHLKKVGVNYIDKE